MIDLNWLKHKHVKLKMQSGRHHHGTIIDWRAGFVLIETDNHQDKIWIKLDAVEEIDATA